MVSRRKFLLAGGAGIGVGAAYWGWPEGRLFNPVSAASAEASAVAPVPPAPSAFVNLADDLSGHIGIDRQLVNRVYQLLSGLIPDVDVVTSQLQQQLQGLAQLAPPQRLASLGPASRDLFSRLIGALYNGTIDMDANTRTCVGFETLASHDVTADYVRPPSYCVGSPNFWVDPPVAVKPEGVAHG